MYRKTFVVIAVLLFAVATIWPLGRVMGAGGAGTQPAGRPAVAESPVPKVSAGGAAPASGRAVARPSHRLIVQLESPSVTDWAVGRDDPGLFGAGGRLLANSQPALNYAAQLGAEQDAFLKAVAVAVPGMHVSTFLDERNQAREARYTLLMNGVAVERAVGDDASKLKAKVEALPGVRAVYADVPYDPDLYVSIGLIDAPYLYDNPGIGGSADAGAGIKIASMDGGIYHLGPMFSGEGFSYPFGYPLGDTRNTNGKIIVSRVYFRSWDPPSPGDENAWPGTQGTSHGEHTSSIAMGEPVDELYEGVPVHVAGVAPRAYAMSYRVFYNSIQGISSFYSVEGVAALEDIVRDGADVVNNSWGSSAYSAGGEGNALDFALIRAWRAGVFVSMSAGNAGPSSATVDHPSPEYIDVGATTTSGQFRTEGLNVTAPEPVTTSLRGIDMQPAAFGGTLEPGTVFGPYPFVPAQAISATNNIGCSPFDPGSFEGSIAVISRGVCDFGQKALFAQDAGALGVVIHNDAARGDSLVYMSGGTFGVSVTIPAVFIGYTGGAGLTEWYAENGAASQLEISTKALQIGNVPDVLAGMSSRGPGVGYVLKPDIAAPGINILAEGFADATGEARHLGLGQASGTSMASPFVAGSAALVKQVHRDWSPAAIKSALMSTSKFIGIYVDSDKTTPAQPLDMGAGRLDLKRAADPGVVLDPPSLSFGKVVTGAIASLALHVTSVADTSETYNLSSIDVSYGYTPSVEVAGLSFSQPTLDLAPGATGTVTVTWDTTVAAHGYGDNQGYVVLASQDGDYEAHLAAWIRVGLPSADKDVLLIDNDGSAIPPAVLEQVYGQPVTFTNYTPYYTDALDALGQTYDVLDVDPLVDINLSQQLIPDANWLEQYPVIVYQTGDLNASVMSSDRDQAPLREFSNHGGAIIAFGQNLAAVLGSNSTGNGTFFYDSYLGADFLNESINDGEVFTTGPQVLVGLPGSPFAGYSFDVSARGDGAGNQDSIDEIRRPEASGAIYTEFDDVRQVMMYGSGGSPRESGIIAMSNRSRPSLETPSVYWHGRNQYFAFGLEGVNSNLDLTPREELMARALVWATDDPTAVISATVHPANEVTTFFAQLDNSLGGDAVTLRWDFGDGTPFTDPAPVRPPADASYPREDADHTYYRAGTYTVRVEAANAFGTVALGSMTIFVPPPTFPYISQKLGLYLPSVSRNASR